MLGYFFVKFWASGKKGKEKSVCIKIVIVDNDYRYRYNRIKKSVWGQKKEKKMEVCYKT